MSSVEAILSYVVKQFSAYVGFAIIVIGLTCNILNIVVFTQLTIFRGKQSSFYLTTESIVNCFQISILFTLRTLIYAFAYDPSQTSIIWCKLRLAIAQTCAIISMTTVCFAAIDQYLSTSYHAHIRRLSTLKLAHHLTCILICLTLLHGVPYVIFYNIQSPAGCMSSSRSFAIYVSFFYYCFLTGLLPIIVSSLFAILAYLNVRRITRQRTPIIRRRLDRQLTAMILVRVCLLIITVLPFTAYQIYLFKASTDIKGTLQIAIEQLVGAVAYIVLICNYSVCYFYIVIY